MWEVWKQRRGRGMIGGERGMRRDGKGRSGGGGEQERRVGTGKDTMRKCNGE